MGKFVQKIIALAMAIVLLVTSVYIDVSLVPKAEAAQGDTPTMAAPESSYLFTTLPTGTDAAVDFSAPPAGYTPGMSLVDALAACGLTLDNGQVNVASPTELDDVARLSNCYDFKDVTINLLSTGTLELGPSFIGLGSEAYPFRGNITATWGKTIVLSGCTALFRCLSAEAGLFAYNPVTIQLDGAGSGLAQVLKVGTATSMVLGSNITINGKKETLDAGTVNETTVAYPANVTNSYGQSTGFQDAGALFGRVEAAGTDFTLTVLSAIDTTGDGGAAGSVSAMTGGSAGGLIGAVEAPGGSLTLALGSAVNVNGVSVLSAGGDAGGLVGRVNGALTLTGESGVPCTGIDIGSVSAYAGSAGGVAGYLTEGSALTLPDGFTVGGYATATNHISAFSQSSTSGNGAGGVVGVLPEGSSLRATNTTVQYVTVAGGSAAGGVTGVLQGDVLASGTGTMHVTNAVVAGNGYSGGYVGHYDAKKEITVDDGVTVDNTELYPLGTALSYSGGLIGCVSASGTDFTVSGVRVETSVKLSTGNGQLAVGGLVGGVENLKTDTFAVRDHTVITSAASNADTFNVGACGGIIGILNADSYALISGVTVQNADYTKVSINAGSNAPTSSAGGVGRVANGASLTVNNCVIGHSNNAQQAVFIGDTGEGSVVRLAGQLDYTSAASFGSVVRRQESSLIYASDSSLSISRGAIAGDDIGSYGQIIDNEAVGNIISFDETAHTASVSSMGGNAVVSGSALTATITSLADYARLAITMTSHGFFSAVEGAGPANYTSKLYGNVTLVLATDTDLTGSGIEGLTRSCGERDNNAFIDNLTVEGNGHTVTLDVGAHYGTDTDADRGLYLHNTTDGSSLQTYAGLVGRCGSLTARDVTVAGQITVNRSGTQTRNYVGGLCGLVNSTLNVDNCVSRVDIGACYNQNGTNNNGSSPENYFGGFVGRCNKGTIDVTMTHCTSAATLTSLTTARTPYMGGFIAQIDGQKGAVVLTDADTTGVTIQGQWTDNNANASANMGALVANISNSAGTSAQTDVTLSGRLGGSVTLNTAKNGTAGGLLGYNWAGVNAVITNTELGGVSTPTSIDGTVAAGSASFAGLVHTASGQMTIGAGTDIQGSYAGGYSSTNNYNGLVVREGAQLYLVVADGVAFGAMLKNHIADGALNVPQSGGDGYFDLLVGTNITGRGTENAPQRGGIVTIETGDGVGELPAAASDWYAFIDENGDYYNPNTRYYTNIAGLSDAGSGADVNLLRWHLNAYKGSGVVAGFGAGATTSLSGDADMSGWCFYPTTVNNATVDLNGHTLTFGLPEGTRAVSAISYSNSQMYMAQTGLILDAVSANSNGTVTVKNGTVTGTVNSWGADGQANSGALVTGTVKGYYKDGKWTTETLDITELELAGLKVAGVTNATAYAPLLVNGMETHVKSTINGLSYAIGTDAATTLLGWAGAPSLASTEKGTDISVNFTNLALYDKEGVFTKGTLFHTVNCGINSYFTYNFTYADDGDPNYTHENVTYGSDSKEMVPEKAYLDRETTVASRVTPLIPGFSFDDYLPYIYQKASETDFTVNEKVGDLDEGDGWGTYAHPYRITKASQMKALFDMVNKGTVNNDGWVIKYPDNVQNPISASTYTYNANAASGREFEKTSGSGADTVSLANVRAWMEGAYYSVLASLDMSAESGFLGGIGTTGGTTGGEHPFHGVIVGNGNTITMPTGITGGNTWGLIGAANGCVVKDLTVSYGGSTPYMANSRKSGATVSYDSYMGGVIARIIGGDNVLDNVTVDIGSDTKFTPHTDTPQLSCVGGYVGLVENGGLLLRNMGASGLYRQGGELYGAQPAGSIAENNYLYVNFYVGRVLDGYVIDQTGVEEEGVWRSGVDNTDSTGSYADYTIVYNALTATSTAGGAIEFVNGADSYDATLSSGAELFVLASAVNSSSGYTTGASGTRQRWGDYDDVGNASASDLISDDVPGGVTYTGVAGNAYSYLGTRFAGGVTIGEMKLMTSKTVNITLDGDANVGGVGNYNTGFRGIGGQFTPAVGTQKTPLLHLGTFDGGGHTVTLGMERRQYGTVSSSAHTLSWDDTRHNGWDTGLFNRLDCAATLTNVTVSGSVKMRVWGTSGEVSDGFSGQYGTDSANKYCYWSVAAGGLAGSFSASANGTRTVSDVYLDGLTVTSADTAGGIVGCEDDLYYKKSGSSTAVQARVSAVYTNCGYENITVTGGRAAGGLVGFGRFHVATMDNTATATSLRDSQISVYRDTYASDAFEKNHMRYIGAGGAVGVGVSMQNEASPAHTLTLQGMEAERLTVWTMSEVSSIICTTGAGGLLGRVDAINLVVDGCTVTDAYIFSGSGDTNTNSVDNLGDFTRDWKVQSYVRYMMSRANNNYKNGSGYLDGAAGGLVGGYGNNSNNDMSTAHTVVLRDCTVTTSSATATSLVAGFVVAGGLMGDLRINNKGDGDEMTVDEMTVEDCRVNPGSGSMLLLGGTRSAGVVAYTKCGVQPFPSLSIARTDVGSEGGATYMLATVSKSDGVAGGLVGESQMNVTVDAATVTNTVLAGNNAGGVLGLGCETTLGHVIQVSDATVRGCLLYGTGKAKDRYSGGIVGTANAKATVELARCAVEECRVEVANTDFRTGGFVGNVLAETAKDGLYANSLLWVNNVLSSNGTVAIYASLLAYGIRSGGKGFSDLTADTANGGLIAGNINTRSAGAEVLGVSRIDENVASPAAYKDVSNGSAKVVYADYSRFVSGTDLASSTDDTTAAGILTSPAYPLQAGGDAQAEITFHGDAVGFVQTSRTNSGSALTNTALAQQSDPLWANNRYSETYGDTVVTLTNLLNSYGNIAHTASVTDVPQASVTDALAVIDGNEALAELPVLWLKQMDNNLDAVLTQYVDLLTRGGFSVWETLGSVSGITKTYAVSTAGVVTEATGGSVRYEDGQFKQTGTFDLISPGKESRFTVLTLHFTSRGAAAYDLEVPMYYPQVMRMETHVRVTAGETYNVSDMTSMPATASDAQIAANGTFTMYIEYAFDEERMADNWNFPKEIYSRNDQNTGDWYDIPAGTEMTLIVLGETAAENRTYYYQADSATKTIRLGDFTSIRSTPTSLTEDATETPLEMPDLASLTSLRQLNGQAITKSTGGSEGIDKSGWGVERYLLVVRLPEDNEVEVSQAYYLRADVNNVRGVDLKKLTAGTDENMAHVALWGETVISASTEYNYGEKGSLTVGGAVYYHFTPSIIYPHDTTSSYNSAVTAVNPAAAQYAVLSYQIIDDAGVTYPIPSGTRISMSKGDTVVKSSVLSGDLSMGTYVFADGNTPRNMLRSPLNPDPNGEDLEDYTLALDFADVAEEDIERIFTEQNYKLILTLSLTESAEYPESGQAAELAYVPLEKQQANSTILSVNVLDDMRDLGINRHSSELKDTTNSGYIDFEVDCTTTATASDLTWSLELSLQRKEQGAYTDIAPGELDDYLESLAELSTASDCGQDEITPKRVITLTGLTSNPVTVIPTEQMADGEEVLWFRLKVNPNIAYFANYKLVATLRCIGDGAPTVPPDHFIYTVAKVSTDPLQQVT